MYINPQSILSILEINLCMYTHSFKMSNMGSDPEFIWKRVYKVEIVPNKRKGYNSFKVRCGWCLFLPVSLSEVLVGHPCPHDT